MRALVIDGGHAPSALAATRELGRGGWTVGVGAAFHDSYAAASRWCKRYHEVPSPAAGLDAFVQAINLAIDDGGYEVIFVSGDAEAMAISFAKDELCALVPYADYPRLKRSFDKLELARVAEKAGVPVPWTLEAHDGALEAFEGPVLVKSRFHWEPNEPRSGARLEARIARDRTAARTCIEDLRQAGGAPILQELIRGQLMGFTILTDPDADPVAELQQMAPLTWRPQIGMPARAHTVPVDEELSRGIRRMLKALGWFGLVQLQFIVSEEGRPHLIDFNGRAYASEGLALAAGINFHDLWGRIATGREWAPPEKARTGLRYQWVEGDVRRCLAGRGSRRFLGLAGCLGYGFGATHPIWAPTDPRPLLRYPRDVLRRFGRRWTVSRVHTEPIAG